MLVRHNRVCRSPKRREVVTENDPMSVMHVSYTSEHLSSGIFASTAGRTGLFQHREQNSPQSHLKNS